MQWTFQQDASDSIQKHDVITISYVYLLLGRFQELPCLQHLHVFCIC